MEEKQKLKRLEAIEYKKSLKKKLLETQLNMIHKYEVLQSEISETQKLSEEEKNKVKELLSHPEFIREALEVRHQTLISSLPSFAEYLRVRQDQEKLDSFAQEGGAASSLIEFSEKAKNETQKALSNINEDLKGIAKLKEELGEVEEKIDVLEASHIIVTGFQKLVVLNAITYYEFLARNNPDFVMIHPEFIKNLEIVHHNVEHNLPVGKDLLYIVVPEIFEEDIRDLALLEQEKIAAKRVRISHLVNGRIGSFDNIPEYPKRKVPLSLYEELKYQEWDMRDFIYKKATVFMDKYSDYIEMRVSSGQYKLDDILASIELRPESSLTEEELRMREDLKEMWKLQQDYNDLILINQEKVFKEQRRMGKAVHLEGWN